MNIEKAKAELQQLADKLKAELDVLEEWPQHGDTNWTIVMGSTCAWKACWSDTPLDHFRKSIGWVWRTEAEAQRQFNKLQATERVKQYIAKANKGADWVADFNHVDQLKMTWQYSHDLRDIQGTAAYYAQRAEAWRYIKPELFDQLVADCGDDIKLIMGVE